QALILALLRGREIVGAALKQRGRIRHRFIEPCRIETVTKIVVRVDISPGLAFGVAMQPMANALQRPHQGTAAEDRVEELIVHAEQIEKRAQTRRLPSATQIGLGDADAAATEKSSGKAEIADDHRCGRPRLPPTKSETTSVGQNRLKRSPSQA